LPVNGLGPPGGEGGGLRHSTILKRLWFVNVRHQKLWQLPAMALRLRKENYLPEQLIGARYYQPSERGYEKIIKTRLGYWRKLSSAPPKKPSKKDVQCEIKKKEKT